jgi:hypothetical protein
MENIFEFEKFGNSRIMKDNTIQLTNKYKAEYK